MEITTSYGIENAGAAIGHVVVIDVLRAFTTAAYAFDRGVTEILLVSSAAEAFQLRRSRPDLLLVGEEQGRKIEGFDFGNSPDEISRLELRGRQIVLRSSSGTQGVVRASQASRIYLGSLVVAGATARHLQKIGSTKVTLLAMGSVHGPDKEEDLACQDYLRRLLRGDAVDIKDTIRNVTQSPAAQAAMDPAVDWKTPADLECAVAVDRFPFAMPVARENGQFVARAIYANASRRVVSRGPPAI